MYVISHNYAKIAVDSFDSLPQEKILTLDNVIILIKSFYNKDKKATTAIMYFSLLF